MKQDPFSGVYRALSPKELAEMLMNPNAPSNDDPAEDDCIGIEEQGAILILELWAEVERQAHHIKELQEKIDAEKSCACSFDAAGDVCAVHSPALMDARAEVDRLRAALMEISQYETSAPAGFEWDIIVEELVALARKTLEAKP